MLVMGRWVSENTIVVGHDECAKSRTRAGFYKFDLIIILFCYLSQVFEMGGPIATPPPITSDKNSYY